MSRASQPRPGGKAAVSAAIDPLRGRLEKDAGELTLALLALAKSETIRPGPFNGATKQDRAALQVLDRWRRDAEHALHRLHTVPSGARGRHLAERWLKALIAALGSQRRSLSVVDPMAAVDAADATGRQIDKYLRLEAQMDRELA